MFERNSERGLLNEQKKVELFIFTAPVGAAFFRFVFFPPPLPSTSPTRSQQWQRAPGLDEQRKLRPHLHMLVSRDCYVNNDSSPHHPFHSQLLLKGWVVVLLRPFWSGFCLSFRAERMQMIQVEEDGSKRKIWASHMWPVLHSRFEFTTTCHTPSHEALQVIWELVHYIFFYFKKVLYSINIQCCNVKLNNVIFWSLIKTWCFVAVISMKAKISFYVIQKIESYF